MTDASGLRERCVTALRGNAAQPRQCRAFVGFDGFVDQIVHLVDQRQDAAHYERLRTLAGLGQRVLAAAGRSTNIEGVVQQVKLGGNGPIMANALAALGLQVTCVGALGWPAIHPVFQELAGRATIHGVAEPGQTDALEFEDGKLMITKTAALHDVTWANIRDRLGAEHFRTVLGAMDLVAFVNWTMIPHMSDIWEVLLREIVPSWEAGSKLVFFDLADPQKRTRADILRALDLMQEFARRFPVTLGLNEKEAWEIAEVLGLAGERRDRDSLARVAGEMARRIPLDTLVVHPVSYALAIRGGGRVEVAGPFAPDPKITTGAGDHFNAGFCLGRLLGFDLELSLLTGVTASGYYVREARSPSREDLIEFLSKG